MRLFSRTTVAKGLATLTVAIALVGVGVFIGSSPARATTTGVLFSRATSTMIVTEDAATVYTSGSWTTVTSQPFFYTSQSPRAIRIRFTAESSCSGSGGWCSVRILVGNSEARPAVGTDFAFDTAIISQTEYQSHSMERIYDGVFGSGVTIKVQAAVVSGASSLRLDDWTLDVDVLE